MIQISRYLMNRGARDLAACGKCALIRVKTGKRRQQGRVNIDQSPGVMRYKSRRQNTHEAGQYDQRRIVYVDPSLKFGIKSVTRLELPVIQRLRCNAQL